jgi:sugar/nucleoside kinase (ribokinase family)
MKILVAGEINPDLIMSGCNAPPEPGKEIFAQNYELTLGSSSAICAVGLARLGNEVVFVGTVGADANGDFCLTMLNRERVDVTWVSRREDLTTGITVSISSRRDRSLVTFAGAMSRLSAGDISSETFAGSRHLHVSGYFLQTGLHSGLPDLFRRARAAGLTTSLDCGYDPTETWDSGLLAVLEETDVFFPNEIETRGITGQSDPERGLQLLENGRTLLIEKLGSGGCIARDCGRTICIPAFPVEVVDTTGAGDSFVAGFLHGWLRRQDLTACLRLASACGALSTRGIGGTGAQPRLQEVETFLAAHPEKEAAKCAY